MPYNDHKIIRRFTKMYKTKERFTDALINHPSVNMMQNKNPKMARLTLNAYWVYYRELSQVERGNVKIENFVHSYVSKRIYEDLL